MTGEANWAEVAEHLDNLYTAVDRLEELFPGRKFTLDGHLVGSVGEVVAAYMFELELNTASTHGHDATSSDGRAVEVKLTQGARIAIRHEPEHLLVLLRPRGGPLRVVFNGPGAMAWNAAGKKQDNGQCPISLATLSKLDAEVADRDRLAVKRAAPV